MRYDPIVAWFSVAPGTMATLISALAEVWGDQSKHFRTTDGSHTCAVLVHVFSTTKPVGQWDVGPLENLWSSQ